MHKPHAHEEIENIMVSNTVETMQSPLRLFVRRMRAAVFYGLLQPTIPLGVGPTLPDRVTRFGCHNSFAPTQWDQLPPQTGNCQSQQRQSTAQRRTAHIASGPLPSDASLNYLKARLGEIET
jgi:hypothetical protein